MKDTERKNEYMYVAKNLAKDNLITNAGGPFGACVVKNGKIIGKGSNQVLAKNDPTAHAEIVAIRQACENIESYDLSGSELSVMDLTDSSAGLRLRPRKTRKLFRNTNSGDLCFL